MEVSGTVITNHARMLLEAARQGLGVVLVPSLYCAAYLRNGTLQQVLPSWGWPLTVNALFPGARHPPLKVRMLVELLAEHFRDSPSLSFVEE